MNSRTFRTTLLAACTAISLGSAPARAAASGAWEAYESPTEGCSVETTLGGGKHINIAVAPNSPRFSLGSTDPGWNMPNHFTTTMSAQVDGNWIWQAPNDAAAFQQSVWMAIDPASAREFVHQVTAGATMNITVAGIAQPITVNLSGLTAAWPRFMRCVKVHAPAVVASLAPTQAPAAPVIASPPANPAEVALVTAHGVREVSGTVNGTASVNFILDSGAAVVVLPETIAETLRQAGSLTLADYRGTNAYTIADGRRMESALYNLRSLTIGGRTVTDVLCAVVRGDETALLGQSFLSRIGSWSIDNARQTLVLGAVVSS